MKKMKAVGLCVLSILVLVIAQSLAMLLGSIATVLGLPGYVEAVLDALLYPLLAFVRLKLTTEKIFKYSMRAFRIGRPQIKWYWAVVSVLLPVFVIGLFQFTGGVWEANNADASSRLDIALWGVCYYSIAAGIVEEMVFRGVIMGAIEKEFNLAAAIIAPSVLFGLVHLIGNTLDFASVIQLVVAGTLVGIMFSLIEYQSDNFWNNAMVHAFWNMSTIGLCHIGPGSYDEALFTYVLPQKSAMLTGGDFGIEASGIAILGYGLVSILALTLIKKNKRARLNA